MQVLRRRKLKIYTRWCHVKTQRITKPPNEGIEEEKNQKATRQRAGLAEVTKCFDLHCHLGKLRGTTVSGRKVQKRKI